ncbi:DUF2489 domain-containing protein [Alteromonas sp. KUL49]|uniref:DUF2489 domain-containing protein n=1 Tax=Alteromonas sp. KUL49 TaxID=2480798 RepID=UPI0010FFB5F8|nr:DUF2489 domain-containing protein [Alteromonas sp. KUL49]GEA09646.1 hypothetical protein KUL49_00210 [Alteromonas sp. KUL49]
MPWIYLAVCFAALIIIGLSFYAGRLLFLLKQQKERQNSVRSKRIYNISESVHVIAMAMEQQQCELSEGVIRIVNLLNALPIDPQPDFKNHLSTHSRAVRRNQRFCHLRRQKKRSLRRKSANKIPPVNK